ncbi:hypothetical protein [Acetivibrio clariflavus]|uniref:Uncharacterized protein n=1 Tax=Acetivibrio clariflavus (strain DSM 19732 / NBRC 101661 / EBR45) TaxID=720554 RepID=G8LUB2_ACECE|nr:hypothetical protein [Acetivibrio clariflavus]AEV69544.1 hypothetical protein Clocl_3009 [Acetivibrio clariflavus DSM 19732]
MKKSLSIALIGLLILANIIQFMIILNKNSQIDLLKYSKEDEVNIFQATNELERNLYKYEINPESGNYYYASIEKVTWILSYMEYNIKYSNENDPLFQYNLALNNLIGFMVSDQGKELVTLNCSKIRQFLHDIVAANNESRIKDRNKSITEFYEYMINSFEIKLDSENIDVGNNMVKVTNFPVPKVNP